MGGWSLLGEPPVVHEGGYVSWRKTQKDPWQARSGQLLEMNETAVVWVSEVVWNSFLHFMSYIWGNRGPRTLSDSPKLSKPGSSDSTSGFLCSSRQSSCLLSVCLLQLEISTVLGALVTADPILFPWVWNIVSGTLLDISTENIIWAPLMFCLDIETLHLSSKYAMPPVFLY